MLLSLFKGKSPVILLLITLVAFILWFNSFKGFAHLPAFVFDKSPMPFYAFLNNLLAERHFWRIFIAFVILMAQAFMLVHINVKYYFIGERTYLPAIIFVILASSIAGLNRLNPVTFSTLLLLFAIDRILASFRKDGLAYNYFDAAFLISMSSLFYANSIFFMLIVWLGLLIYRSFRFREWIYTFIGLLLPYIFVVSYYYITQQDVVQKISLLSENIADIRIGFLPRPAYLFFILLTLFLMLLSGRKVALSIVKMKIHARKTNWFLLGTFLIILFIYFVLPSASFELIIPASVPLAYNFSYYFSHSRKKLFASIFFTLYLILVLAIQFYEGSIPFLPSEWAINQPAVMS